MRARENYRPLTTPQRAYRNGTSAKSPEQQHYQHNGHETYYNVRAGAHMIAVGTGYLDPLYRLTVF